MNKKGLKGKVLKIASVFEPNVYNMPFVGHMARNLKMASDRVEWQNKQEEMLVDILRSGNSQDISCYFYGNRQSEVLKTALKNPQSLKEELLLTYEEYVVYLLNKHGPAKYNYFYTDSCKDKNMKIERLEEGLFCHHLAEECHVSFKELTDTEYADSKPFSLYDASHFVYCDYFEHLLLHIKIAQEDVRVSNGMPVGIDMAEARKIWREINKFYETGKLPIANKAAAELIVNRYDDYLEILKFVASNGDISKFCDLEDLSVDANGVIMQKIYNDLKEKLGVGD